MPWATTRVVSRPWRVSERRTWRICWPAILTGCRGSPPTRICAARNLATCSTRSSHAALEARPLAAALRLVRGDELVRLGARELELGLDTEVGRELAHLAEACFDAAIAACGRELTARYGAPRYIDDAGVEREATLCVVGMGKLGGEELNFASDVDVIYVYSSDNGTAGELSLHEYFAKLCAQITAALAELTEDDLVFRVDLRLRPEGAQGRDRLLARLARALLRDVRTAMGTSGLAQGEPQCRRSRARCRDHEDADAVRVSALTRRRRSSTRYARSITGSSASSCAAAPASISRTAKAESARSSSSCKRCS